MFARETQLFHIFVKGTEHESTRAFTKEEPHLNQFTNIQCYKYSIFFCLESLIVRRHRFHDGKERQRGRAVVLEHEIS